VSIYGGKGNDKIKGGTDGDYLWGDAGTDTVWGYEGNDEIHLDEGTGGDVGHGGINNDTCTVDPGDTCD
jgi:Ca2+-binding RTX toxin-like protein